MPEVSIAIADDHALIRQGIITQLQQKGGFEVIISAGSGNELLDAIKRGDRHPDVCIIDINMPGLTGFDTVQEIKKLWPWVRIIILSVFDMEMYVIRMIRYGVDGYLLKNSDPEELYTALSIINAGGQYYSRGLERSLVKAVREGEKGYNTLTPKELQVLKYCATELPNSVIARKIGCTIKSLESHVTRLNKKLNVNGRIGLALYAVQCGLLPLEIDKQIPTNNVNSRSTKK
jgi:two-component system, NarL family, invasion response regulator UvrY